MNRTNSKILDKCDQQLNSSSIQQFKLLKGLPFYDWPESDFVSTITKVTRSSTLQQETQEFDDGATSHMTTILLIAI
jgi:hypothetical protein